MRAFKHLRIGFSLGSSAFERDIFLREIMFLRETLKNIKIIKDRRRVCHFFQLPIKNEL